MTIEQLAHRPRWARPPRTETQQEHGVAQAEPVEVDDPVTAGAVRDFPTFFRAEMPRLAGYCAGLLGGDREAGADAAQEALVRTYARWVSVREPRAYAYLVATNLVRDSWRRGARDRAAMSELGHRAVGAASAQPAADGSVRDLVERLPERLRVPTLLHYYADLPVDDVARALRRPSGTVRAHLHEARRALAIALEESSRA